MLTNPYSIDVWSIEMAKERMVKGISQEKTAPEWYKKFHISDHMTLLHLPFSGIVMAFVVIGATMANEVHINRLILALMGVFSALQSSHYLDEIKGHPWNTKISDRLLYLTGFAFLAIGAAIGIYLSLTVSLLIAIFILPALFFPVAYSLELWKDKFHNPLWFGVSWGALTYLGSYFLQSLTINLVAIIMSIAIGIQSAYILILYEGTKIEKTRNISWNVLKGTVLLWIFIALAMLAMKFS